MVDKGKSPVGIKSREVVLIKVDAEMLLIRIDGKEESLMEVDSKKIISTRMYDGKLSTMKNKEALNMETRKSR